MNSGAEPPRSPDSVLGVALLLSLAWSLEVTLRFGAIAGVVPTFMGTLGATALTLGTIGVAARSLPSDPALGGVVRGALLASGAIAVVGGVLAEKTHHRALGGVTVAFVAVGLIVAGTLVARRLRSATTRTRAWLFLTTLMVVSVSVALGPALLLLGGGGDPPDRLVADDLLVCAALVVCTVLSSRRDLPARRGMSVGWAVSVVTGLGVLAASMPLRAMLAAHAPMALGPVASSGILGRIPALPPKVPVGVDVSPH